MRFVWILLGFSVCCQAQPVINAITNAASYSARISPGSVITIFGTGFASGPTYAADVPLPPQLGGVDVVIDGYSAPMLYVDQYQINCIIPYEVAAGAQSFQVDAAGTASTTVTIDTASPGLFQYTGRAFAANYPSNALNSASAPAPVGSYLIVYLTGIGPLTVTPADGDAASANPLSQATTPFSATIGGVDAPVTFLGLAPDYVGLAQANIQVPQLPTGDYPLTLTVNNVKSTSAIVSVSGSGTTEPNILSYLSVVGIPTSTIQTNIISPASVQPNGRYVYVCDKDHISAIDTTSTSAPQLISVFGSDNLAKSVGSCAVNQNYLLYLENTSVLTIYDLASSPTQPPVVAGPANLQVPGATSVAFNGNTALFSTSAVTYSGTQIQSESGYVEAYDLSNYANPIFASAFNPTSSGFTPNTSPRYGLQYLTTDVVAVMGTTNTGTDSVSGEGQFTVLDVTNPTAIQPIVEVSVPGTVVLQASALEGSLALIAGNTQAIGNPFFFDPVTGAPEFLFNGDLTLTTVDFSVVDQPILKTTIDTGIPSSGVANVVSLGGGYFAVAIAPPGTDYNGPSTLAVVDATDELHPAIYQYADIEGLSGMAVQNGILYATSSAGVTLYTISLIF